MKIRSSFQMKVKIKVTYVVTPFHLIYYSINLDNKKKIVKDDKNFNPHIKT